MWGKLTERNDRIRTKIIAEPHEVYRFLATPGIEVTNLAFASNDVVWLTWKLSAEEYAPNLTHTNEVMIECDLLDVQSLAKYGIYRYILSVIVFSKYLRVVPVKTKSSPAITSAFGSLFHDEDSRRPVWVRRQGQRISK